MPHFSIIIPTFNRAGIIGRTLDSICRQTFSEWECIVVDDHSTDNTKVLVEDYCKKDSRFRYLVNNRTKGAQGSRNTGWMNARNEWVLFFDSDNILHEDMLFSMANEIEERGESVDVFTCFSNVIDRKTSEIVGKFEWICEGDIRRKIVLGECYVDFNSSIINKSKLSAIGCLDESCVSMQEWDTHIRLSEIAHYHTLQRILVDYYVGDEDAISADDRRDIIGNFDVLSKHRQRWSNDMDNFLIRGENLYHSIKKQADKSFRKTYTKKLFELMPELRKVLLRKRLRGIRHGVAHFVKSIISKK